MYCNKVYLQHDENIYFILVVTAILVEFKSKVYIYVIYRWLKIINDEIGVN